MRFLPSTAPPRRRRTATDDHRADLFREAAAIVRVDFAAAITLTAIADRVKASPRQLHRAFKEAGGTTFGAYVRDVRMAHAAELIGGTDLPVGEVASSVGYRQPSQFTKAFKRVHGKTPSHFRMAAKGLVPNGQLP